MKLEEIHLRDPFVLPAGDRYYLYGTRDFSVPQQKKRGFDVYQSRDLVEWSGPTVAFSESEHFFAHKDFWAPEVHFYRGAYYMFASFKGDARCRGTQILKADSPMGPFVPLTDEPITPEAWECLDGTFYVDDGVPYMIFCHEWVQIHDGTICAMPLSEDLTHPLGEPTVLFAASAPSWSDGYRQGDYVTDGPFLYRTQGGRLVMIWSSFSEGRYCEALSYSDSGHVLGPWRHDDRLLFSSDGGHGMIFKTKEGALFLTLHQPNTPPEERAHFFPLEERDDTLYRKDQ